MTSIETDLKKKLVSRNGVFGTTTRRFAHIGSGDGLGQGSNRRDLNYFALGQEKQNNGSLNNNGQAEVRKEQVKPSPSFASASTRFNNLEALKDIKPAPGAYEVGVKWKKGSQGLFHSGGNRFSYQEVDNGIPGPGQYNTPITAIKVPEENEYGRKHMISAAPRFQGQSGPSLSRSKITGPGPGSYETEYLYGNMNKPTFNIALAQGQLRAAGL